MLDDDDPTAGDDDPTEKQVLEKAHRVLADLARLQAEYDRLTPSEKAQMPESVRRFLGSFDTGFERTFQEQLAARAWVILDEVQTDAYVIRVGPRAGRHVVEGRGIDKSEAMRSIVDQLDSRSVLGRLGD